MGGAEINKKRNCFGSPRKMYQMGRRRGWVTGHLEEWGLSLSPPDSHFLVSFYMAFFHRETNVGNRPTDRQKEEGGEKRRGCNETYHWEMVSGQKGQAKRKAQEKRRDRSKFPHFISTVSSTFTLDYFAFGCITARRATRRNFVPPKRERERVVEE